MRKILFSILLATTVATPALAERPHRSHDSAKEERSSDRAQARQDRADSRQDRSTARQDRSDTRQDRAQTRQDFNSNPAQVRQDRVDVRQDRADVRQDRADVRQDRVDVREDRANVRQDWQQSTRNVSGNRNVNERGRPTLDQRNVNTQQRDASRDAWVQNADRLRHGTPPAGARPDRPAPAPASSYNNNYRAPQWHSNWRNDHRYDWNRYRYNHRSLFHLGFYIDPFGWGYQRWGIGWRLWPSYYNSSYWLNDPYMYRLPYAPWPYKWVRYYDDALLVNVYSGQVVDVIYDFFW